MPSFSQSDITQADVTVDAVLLARASRLLAGSLNIDHLVDRLLDLLVPDLVCWAQVSIHEGGGWHRSASRAHDARTVERTSWSPPAGSARSVAGVMASGRRALLPSILSADLETIASIGPRQTIEALVPTEAVVLPLSARGGVFGTLTLLRAVHGSLIEPSRVRVWDDLAQRAALAFDSARLYHERRHAIDVLQQGLHPPALPEIEGLRLASFYRAADAAGGLGGDFYDVHGESGEWTVVLGDVSGKGVEAAVLAGSARQTIRTATLMDRSPDAVLSLLNRVLLSFADQLDERFITVACARMRALDDGGWVVDLSSAGHPAALLLRAAGGVEAIAPAGTLVGLVSDVKHEVATVELGPRDTLLLYTDGVTESRDADGAQFGTDRVQRLLGELPGAAPEAVVSHIARSALEWSASSSHDDIALLAISVDPKGA